MALTFYGNALARLAKAPTKKHQINLADATLIECCDKYTEFQQKKNPEFRMVVLPKLRKLEEITGEAFEPDQITDDFWVAFINWLQVDEQIMPSTVATYCQSLKSCLKWAGKHGAILDADYDKYDVDKINIMKPALTRHQIDTIYDFDFKSITKVVKCKEEVIVTEPRKVRYHKRYGSKKPYVRYKRVIHEDGTSERIAVNYRADWFKCKVSTIYVERKTRKTVEVEKTVPLLCTREINNLNRVRDMFVLSCMLFQRHSDMVAVRPDCFNADKTVYKCVQQKTGQTAVVDLKKYCVDYKICKAILEKYNYTAPFISSTTEFNLLIHKMLKLIGGEFLQNVKTEYKRLGEIVTINKPLYELISSHAGRRTAITYNALVRKVPHLDVMRCSGHADFRSFQRYLKYDDND